MEIKDKAAALGKIVAAYVSRYRSAWVPYVLIAVFLAGVWIFWNGTTKHDQITGEMKDSKESSSPLFHCEKTGNEEARLVCGITKLQRTKPLPDLFAGTETVSPDNPVLPPISAQILFEEKKKEEKAKKQVVPVSPQLCGFIETEGRSVAILSAGGHSRSCAVGESIGGWRVAYINDGTVGLENNGIIIELSAMKGD